jgi:acyl dehydratase
MTTALQVASVDGLRAWIGKEIVSDWADVTQERINQFAAATGDFQWIHVDPERAKNGPFGTTIAHGFLTLSMLAGFTEKTLGIQAAMSINYGLNKVRFISPVPSGSRLRAKFTLQQVKPIEGGSQSIWQAVIEREGSDKPACIAETVRNDYF